MVFPDDQWVAKAVHLLNSATAMNERSWVPVATFMNGESVERWPLFQRTLFEIPAEHVTQLFEQMNDSNKGIVNRYMQNLSTIASRLEGQNKDLNDTVSSMKQSDAFGSVLSMLDDFNNNPGAVIQKLTGGDAAGIENMAETLSQNPQVAQMVNQVAENIDVTQLATVLPLLGGLAPSNP